MGNSRYGLNIDNIRLTENSANLHKIISAITALDICISSEHHIPSSYKHGKILSSLFNYILNDERNKNLNQFVYDTFDCFRYNKHQIRIDLPKLDEYNNNDDGKLMDLIIYKLGGVIESADNEINMNNINMLKPQLFKIFPNIDYVYINTCNVYGDKEYVICLSQLLSLIVETSVNKVKILAFSKSNSSSSWINKLWNASSGSIIQSFTNKNFSIRYESQYHVEYLIIERN